MLRKRRNISYLKPVAKRLLGKGLPLKHEHFDTKQSENACLFTVFQNVILTFAKWLRNAPISGVKTYR